MTKFITIGNFSIDETTAASGACSAVTVRNNSADPAELSKWGVAEASGSEGGWAALTSGSSTPVVTGSSTATGSGNSNGFTVVDVTNGSSTMSGIDGVVESGGVCFTSGYVTGV